MIQSLYKEMSYDKGRPTEKRELPVFESAVYWILGLA